MLCHACHKYNPSGTEICSRCNLRLEAATLSQTAEETPPRQNAPDPSPQKPILERLMPFAPAALIAIGAVPALGFPAALNQFVQYGVPVGYLSTERAAKAGIVPAIALVILALSVWGAIPLLRRMSSVRIRNPVIRRLIAGMVIEPLSSVPLFVLTFGYLILAVGYQVIMTSLEGRPLSELMSTPFLLAFGLVPLTYASFTYLMGRLTLSDQSEEDDTDSRRKSRPSVSGLDLAATALLGYVLAAVFYSSVAYPAVPQYLGGGRPDAIVLWIESSEFPPEFEERLPSAKCTKEGDPNQGSLRMCENIYLIDASSDNLIITDDRDDFGDAVILPTRIVQLTQ